MHDCTMPVRLSGIRTVWGLSSLVWQLLAILAFATTVSFSTTFSFHATVIDCPDPNDVVRSVVSYPFA